MISERPTSHHARPVVFEAQDDASSHLSAHARHLFLGGAIPGEVFQLGAHNGLDLVNLVGLHPAYMPKLPVSE